METRRRSSNRSDKCKTDDLEEHQSQRRKKKWTDDEQIKLLRLMKIHGHKNVDKISRGLTGRSKGDIRKFLTSIHSQVHKPETDGNGVPFWLSQSISETEKKHVLKYKDSIQVAQVIKLLSVDGLLENHPSPKRCGGIDFACAYRVLYQCLMGYPVQPVNKSTADFIIESLDNLNPGKNHTLIQKLTKVLQDKFGTVEKESNASIATNSSSISDVSSPFQRKPIAVYQRKRPANVSLNPSNLAPTKVIIAETAGNNSSSTKPYSVTIAGNSQICTVDVPVAPQRMESQLEKVASELQSRTGFNPFSIPQSYLKKQFYSN